MKRIIPLLLIITLFLSVLPICAKAEEESADPVEAVTSTALTAEEAGNSEDKAEEENPEDTGDAEEPTPPQEDDLEFHKSYIQPSPEGLFRPEDQLTRFELAEIFYTLGEYAPGPHTFSDVPDDAPYAEAVNALAKAGILKGYSDGTFRPTKSVTRAQLVTVLARLSGKTTDQAPSFSDVKPGYWAYKYIALSEQMGWIKGYSNGTFQPDRAVNRAEAVTVFNRFLNRIPDRTAIKKWKDALFYFPDVSSKSWYYYDVMEATIPHRVTRTVDGVEQWVNTDSLSALMPDGFYCSGTRLFALMDGIFIHSEGSFSLNGVNFDCEGTSCNCVADAETLYLANGHLLLLEGGKPCGVPGAYETGFYVMNGLLYAAENGFLVHEEGEHTLNTTTYYCEGDSGICQVEDWRSIPICNADLSYFSANAPADPVCSFGDVSPKKWYYRPIAILEHLGIMNGVGGGLFAPSETVSHAQALKVAVEIYERYYHIKPGSSTRPWYRYYVNKALEYGILDQALEDYEAPAVRGDVAVYLYRSMRGRELAEINIVDEIPDVPESSAYYPYVYPLYTAGILRGSDKSGTANLSQNITRAELAAMLTRLLLYKQRLHFTLAAVVEETIQYGTSGSGNYPLIAYRLGTGENVLVLTFAIHGWEDHWNRDGQELVDLANQTKRYLEQNYSVIAEKGWTVYILPCLNPDGLNLGNSHNGPGRCTTTYYNASGTLVTGSGRGIDMNRCFPYNYTSFTTPRNFNGTAPLQCVEAQALAAFMRSVKGSGINICIDTHGWYSQIITSSGQGAIYNAFHKQFPNNSYGSLSGSKGYFSAWAAFALGFDSCLFELPGSVYSHSDFLSLGCAAKYEAAIADILKNYTAGKTVRGPMPAEEVELNGN